MAKRKNISRTLYVVFLFFIVVFAGACQNNQSDDPVSTDETGTVEEVSESTEAEGDETAVSDDEGDDVAEETAVSDESPSEEMVEEPTSEETVTAASNPYEKYAGQTIVVSWPSNSHYNKALELIPEFEELTGINVEVDMVQYLNLHDKQVLEMSKPDGGDYDLVSWVVMWKTEYVNKGLVQPLAPFFTNASLYDPSYDAGDIVDGYLATGGAAGGHRAYLPGPTQAMYAIPFGAETSFLTYRTDIFEEHNLEVPETYDELLETAEYITENVDGVYGITSRGSTGHQISAAWLFHLSPYGGGIFDDEWNPIVNNAEGIAAAEALQTIFENSPPGVASFGVGDAHNTFLQGEAAMFLDHHVIAPLTRNPELSRVDGNVGYALHPTANQCGSETGGFALGIPTNAQNPEAAFLFMQWLTSKEQDRKMVELGGESIRKSTLNDPALQATHPEWEVLLEQLECADPDWRPLIPEWDGISQQILGVLLAEAMAGNMTIEEALGEAAVQIRAEMDRAGYYGVWSDQ